MFESSIVWLSLGGGGCGAVDGTVASDIREPWFKSQSSDVIIQPENTHRWGKYHITTAGLLFNKTVFN